MNDRRIQRFAWATFVLTVGLSAASLVLLWLTRDTPRPDWPNFSGLGSHVVDRIQFVALGLVGALVVTRNPRNRVGWIVCVAGVGFPLVAFAEAYATYSLVTVPGSLPAADWAAWMTNWSWALTYPAPPLLFLLFPTGEVSSRRWRPVALVAAANWALIIVLTALHPSLRSFPTVSNPLGLASLGAAPDGLLSGLFLLTLLVTIAGVASLVVRFARSRGEERLQQKAFLYGAIVFAVSWIVVARIEIEGPVSLALEIVPGTALVGAFLVAMLKYRLYDIDVVISKTVVFGGLAAFITAIYVGIVVGLGSLLGAGDEPNLALSIVATAVVAVAFQPARERLTRFANRLVFGHRATPYEVLSSFAGDLAQAAAPERTLERMAKLVADGTRAERVFVWLRVGGTMRPTAVWPEVFLLEPVPERELDDPAVFADFDHIEEVIHDGELLGAITLTEPRGEALNHTEHELLSNLAGQVALLLRNLRLTEELRARIADLHASRRRLVQAQDDEHRRLERDLHDGSYQQLAHLRRAARQANESAEREGAPQAANLLAQIADDGEEAIRTVQELAHGIYPPLLVGEGLPAAMEARTARAAVPVAIEADGVGRYDREIEAAVYFCVLEAVNNAAKYANPSQVTIRLSDTDGQLTFEVSDDGTGFDPDTTPRGHGLTNMTDRLDALDGTLHLASAPGEGTRVNGRIPTVIPSGVRT